MLLLKFIARLCKENNMHVVSYMMATRSEAIIHD